MEHVKLTIFKRAFSIMLLISKLIFHKPHILCPKPKRKKTGRIHSAYLCKIYKFIVILCYWANYHVTAIECNEPSTQINSKVVERPSFLGYQAVVKFQCNSGYQLVSGDMVIICMENGNWSGNTPTCKGKDNIITI